MTHSENINHNLTVTSQFNQSRSHISTVLHRFAAVNNFPIVVAW